MSSSLRSGKGNREVSPPRRTSTVDLVKDLARLRDADPAKFPSAYAKLKANVPDLDHLLNVFGPPSFLTARTPSSASSAATPRTGHVGSPPRQRRRAPAPFGSPLGIGRGVSGGGGGGGGAGGESLLDVSAISGIAGDDNNDFNNSELFRVAGSSSGISGGGGGGGGRRFSVSGGDLDDSDILGGGGGGGGGGGTHPPRPPERTAAAFDAALLSPTFLDHRAGGVPAASAAGVGAAGRSRTPTLLLLRNGGGGGGTFGRGDGEAGGWDARLDESRGDIQQLLSGLPPMPSEVAGGPPPDVQDVRCIRLHEPILLRGSQGRYLRIRQEEEEEEGEDFDDNASTTTAATGGSGGDGSAGGGGGGRFGGSAAGTSVAGVGGEGEATTLFGVEAEGTGTGDPAEVVQFVSASRRHDRGPVKYGEAVTVKSMHGKGKLLRVSSSGAVIFARVHAGRSERWTVLPCQPTGGPSSVSSFSRGAFSSRGGGGRGSRELIGTFVRKGDRVELEHTAHSGPNKGAKTSLVMRPRDYGGDWEVAAERRDEYRGEDYEAWEIASAGVPYLPPWRRNRPYLTGDFLLDPPQKTPSRAVAKLFGISPADLASVDFSGPGAAATGAGGSGVLPEAVQEEVLLDDLLYALMGFAGSYVVVRGVDGLHGDPPPSSLADLEFTVNREAIDQSLAYLAERVLPLCNNYVRVNRFATERGQYEFGKVAHALAAGMQRLLREYLVLVAQLENQLLQGKLSLQRLWFYVQPSMRTMETLEALTVELRDLKGGAMLRQLRTLAGTGGDEASRQLQTFLLHQASVPYLEMLETWIYHGDLNDQYGEFMIGQAEDVHKKDVGQDFNTRYWSGRYLLRAGHVIASLAGRQEKILITGKYLNVVRECGRRVDCPLAGPIPSDPGSAGEGLYAKVIDGAYDFASRCLMDLVVREGELLPRLESIKHYFLLDRGDFFGHFLDCAEAELDKTIPQISVPRLESLLHLSVQMSSASHDPFKDDLSLEFSGRNLLKQLEMIHRHGGVGDPDVQGVRSRAVVIAAGAGVMSSSSSTSSSPLDTVGGDYARRIIQGTAELRGVEGLMMSYKVRWPVSLVLSKKSLTKYQLLFRHIFFAKHVQRLLSKRLMDHQDTKQLELRGLMMQSYLLRQRMLHFMQNLVYYMMVEVVEPRWHQFMDDLRKLCGESGKGGGAGGGTLDDVLKRHEQFQDLCLKECLLTNIGLLKSLTRVMISCLHFGDQGALFAEERRRQEEVEKVAEEEARVGELERQRAAAAAGGSSGGVRAGRAGSKGLSGAARTAYFQRRSSSMRSALDTTRYREYIRESREGFDASLHVFAGQLWRDAGAHYHSHLNNLCARLDYNGFFTRKYCDGSSAAAGGSGGGGGGGAGGTRP